MESWLASHALEVIFGVIVALSGGWIGLHKRLRRQYKESRAEAGKLKRELARTRQEHELAKEFNLKDRWTIEELAAMVHDYREQLGLPEQNILVVLNRKAEARLHARRLSASIHTTSSPAVEEFLSDE
jgi:hypothetical protein